jgi:hypothetical protein
MHLYIGAHLLYMCIWFRRAMTKFYRSLEFSDLAPRDRTIDVSVFTQNMLDYTH